MRRVGHHYRVTDRPAVTASTVSHYEPDSAPPDWDLTAGLLLFVVIGCIALAVGFCRAYHRADSLERWQASRRTRRMLYAVK